MERLTAIDIMRGVALTKDVVSCSGRFADVPWQSPSSNHRCRATYAHAKQRSYAQGFWPKTHTRWQRSGKCTGDVVATNVWLLLSWISHHQIAGGFVLSQVIRKGWSE